MVAVTVHTVRYKVVPHAPTVYRKIIYMMNVVRLIASRGLARVVTESVKSICDTIPPSGLKSGVRTFPLTVVEVFAFAGFRHDASSHDARLVQLHARPAPVAFRALYRKESADDQ